MARICPILIILALSMLVPFVSGDDTKQADPWSFKSPRAVRAKADYDASIKRAQSQADDLKATARAKLMRDLEGAMADATRAANLDEAVKLQGAIKELKGKADPHSSNELEGRLIGTRWRLNGVVVAFAKNGEYAYSDWGDRRGTWKAMTGQTIACVPPDGRDEEYTFNPAFTFTVFTVNGSLVGTLSREKDK